MELEIIKHSDISDKDLLRIVEIKNVAWPHSIESQLKWIEQNLQQDDFHVILKDGCKDYAYLNLCSVKAFVDNKETLFMGVGNVCSKLKGKGYGGQLMSLVNEYLKKNDFRGLLFCRNHVMRFYAHYDWSVIPNNSINYSENDDNIYIMYYNTSAFEKMIYCDRLF